MFCSEPVSRLSTQMTRCPSRASESQRCDPRKPAPPVTTAVGISSMLPRPSEHRARLHKGFTATLVASVPARCAGGDPLGYSPRSGSLIPLAAYADAGSGLPGLPAFTRSPRDGGLTGDATGFYDATREFMAAWGRMPRLVLAGDALFAVAAAVAVVWLWRRKPAWRPWLVAAALCAFGLVVCVDVHWMKPSGAAVFGWPLLWSLPMLAYRGLGVGLSKHVAWDFGFALSAHLRRAHRRRRRVSRPQRERAPLRRRARGRVLDLLAAARRPDRGPSRVDERAMGGRRRPAQLQRAAVDAARDVRRRARRSLRA